MRSRAAPALLVGGVSSAGNFLLAITVTRLESVGGVGHFAVAFSFYILVSGLTRAMVTDSVLAAGTQADVAGSASARVITVSTVAAAAVVVAGLATGSAYLTIVGAALPGLALYDYAKAVSLGIGSPRIACLQEIGWAALVVAVAVPGLLHLVQPVVVFAGWAGGGALVGLVTAWRQGFRTFPGWRTDRAETRVAASFGAQFLVTTGSAQLALTAVAATAGTAVVGALSAGRTVLGPVNLVVSTASALVLPHLRRSHGATAAARMRAAIRLTVLVTGAAAPLALAVAVLPDRIGLAVLGGNWEIAQMLLPLLVVESLLAVPAVIGFAGVRIEGAGSRALLAGAVLGVLRVPVVVAGAVVFGAPGAAAALVVMALLSAALWWRSYQVLLRRRDARRQLVPQPA
ncbi:hypothetical protein F4558_003380 [Micromonospora profundi]|uniref:hypothetical protein n=1 Tax=Micromonospora profundi TaxID=1420889 RepID=UPI001438CC83|nr:hypothetical protein [Micromonospora profundi]NJC13554.1 hypothetical protein [Micromonospora profundi]